jgi:hypothetical protein
VWAPGDVAAVAGALARHALARMGSRLAAYARRGRRAGVPGRRSPMWAAA